MACACVKPTPARSHPPPRHRSSSRKGLSPIEMVTPTLVFIVCGGIGGMLGGMFGGVLVIMQAAR